MNEVIKNAATGDQIEFIETANETDGRMSKFIMTLAPYSSWAKRPRHFHPFQTETFEVISGELNMHFGDEHFVLKAGDEKIVVEKFVLHCFWNERDQPVVFNAEIYPPKNIEKGLRLTYALSQRGKINKNNIPFNPFHTLILMNYFDAYFTIIPWRLQRMLFTFGAQLAKLFGYRY